MVSDAAAQAQLQAQQPRDRERVACKLLMRVHGPRELHAAVLALLVPREHAAMRQAWQAETAAGAAADTLGLLEHSNSLTAATRLPCFEMLLSRMARHPLTARQALLESTRRVMRARGMLRPIDRLHWLVMRLRLGDRAFFGVRTMAADDPQLLPESDVRAIARYSAYLARMVPVDDTEAPGETPATQTGAAWYATVMAPWPPHNGAPDGGPPDSNGLVQALQELQALAWMHRPVLMRGWVRAAVAHSRNGQLTETAADALRLSCSLLDSPLPPELSRHYSAALQEVRR